MSEYKPLPGNLIFEALHDKKCIVMACNTRIVPGIVKGIFRAAKDTDSAVMFELAKSECNLERGYTGLTPDDYAKKIIEVAEEVGFDAWALHADHIGIKKGTPEELEEVKKLVKAQIDSGHTSFAIDASHLFNFDGKDEKEELEPNIKATIEMVKFIRENKKEEFGLEVEVGEIGRKNDEGMILTTPEEAVAYISSLNDAGITPNLIAISNGSTHGNIYDKQGKQIAQVSIDIERTKNIAKALGEKGFNVKIAQHGITGTPREFIKTMFPHGDLLKGNVGTFWQNIAHEVMKVYEPDLFKEMWGWTLEKFKEDAEKKGFKSDEQIFGNFGKKTTIEFFDRIYSMKKETVDAMESLAYAEAKVFFNAFNAYGTAEIVREYIKNKQ